MTKKEKKEYNNILQQSFTRILNETRYNHIPEEVEIYSKMFIVYTKLIEKKIRDLSGMNLELIADHLRGDDYCIDVYFNGEEALLEKHLKKIKSWELHTIPKVYYHTDTVTIYDIKLIRVVSWTNKSILLIKLNMDPPKTLSKNHHFYQGV